MKVGCIQPQIFQEKSECYKEIEQILINLKKKCNKCDIVCLPERWVPLMKHSNDNYQDERGDDYAFIKKLSKKYHINILSGAIWEKRSDSKKPYITCYFFNRDGKEIGRQDKLHLYSYEKSFFEPGIELKIFEINESKYFAILICFDMAFFETPRLAVENGADIIFSPTQIRDNGMENWDIYLKARALENRVPVVACNTVGSYKRKKYLGNSKIISFIDNKISPAKLKVVEGPIGTSGFIFDKINLNFPRKLRSIRLNEKIDKNKILISQIENKNKYNH